MLFGWWRSCRGIPEGGVKMSRNLGGRPTSRETPMDVIRMDQVPDIERPLRWGLWSLDAGSYVLNHDGDVGYWVDLERCGSSAEVLDWIVQVSHKAWADSHDVAMLVAALDAVLRLQKNVCGLGVDHSVDPKALVGEYMLLRSMQVDPT